MEKVNCILCSSPEYKVLFIGKDLLHGLPGEFPVVKCKNCGLVYTNPRPDPDEIKKYYPKSYAPYHHVITKVKPKSLRQKLIGKLLNLEQIFIPDLPKGARILEIGCANGWFLGQLKDKEWELEGIEKDQRAVEFAQNNLGLNVYQGDIQDMELETNIYDCIFAWMVLEHLHNPKLVLKTISTALKPGGLFVFNIPNIESVEAKIFRQYWYNLDVPRHLCHFGTKNIRAMLATAELRVEKIIHIANFSSFMRSVSFLLSARNVKQSIADFFFDWGTNTFAYKLIARCVGLPYMFILQMFKSSGRIIVISKREN